MVDSQIINQFTTVVILHLLGVMSPGPDFFLIVKQSLCQGRKVSVLTSLGIGSGIIIHVLFCIFGLGSIISKSAPIFNMIMILGALYIIYMGIQSLLVNASPIIMDYSISQKDNSYTAFGKGFITNMLNPKATLFFLSIYTIIINNNPPIYIQLAYGLWMAIATATWFCFLSTVLTNQIIASRLEILGNKIQKIMGIVLLIVGFKILINIFV
ncbi:LysE family transporter [Candidatus Marinimicrobia bacterium]|nr:LysE family transporter [Candidatus Neomarinimicrobiota bacterium]MDB3868614.1 LysE family transporter [Candidatus Neomarinimicrobiota bacterium]